MRRFLRRRTTLLGFVAVALVLPTFGLAPPVVAGDDESTGSLSRIAEQEQRARELVRQGAAERKAYIEGGEVGPRTYEATFASAAKLLVEIIAAAPTPRRLYGLAYARFHSDQMELAHRACDRLAVLYPDEETVQRRCEALTAALHDTVFRVAVNSEPRGARVGLEEWSAQDFVETPGVLWLRAGEHDLVFRLEGHLDLVQKVHVEGGFVSQVLARLQPIPTTGRLELVVDPRAATIEIDGAPAAVPDDGYVELSPGEHRLRIVLDGFKTYEEVLRIATGESLSRWITLIRATEEVPGGGRTMGEPERIPPAPQDNRSRGFAPWGWSAAGVGGAALVSGAVLHALAFLDADDASGIPNLPDRRGEFTAKRDAARDKELSAYILYGIGAALVTTGVVLLVLDEVPDEDSGTVVPRAFRGGGGLTWVSRF